MEGLSLAGGWKAAIAEYYAANGSWPSQPDLNGTTPSVGAYASNVTVNNGVIQITYAGAQVNQAIYNQTLTLVPYTNDNDDVLWQCGLAAPPSGTPASGAIANTTLLAQYLPSSCKS